MSFPLRLRALTCLAAVLLVCGLAQPPLAEGQSPFRILVTNDDGVRAPGLKALVDAVRSLGEVTVIAPADNQSAKGHSLQISDPIYVDTVSLGDGIVAFSATATPATCIKVALSALLSQRPHLVLSGINRDQNLGMVAYISGTVAGAREAALQGIPAIAVSALLDASGEARYDTAARAAAKIAALVKARRLSPGTFLNVNVPALPPEALKGIRLATQSRRAGTETFIERTRPGAGRRYYWNTYERPRGGTQGDDVWTVEQGYVAVTPLTLGEFDAKTYEGWKDAFK